MGIKYVNGDLFTSSEDILAHGCNCSGGFGSGVAGIIAKKMPTVREAYLEKYRTDGWKLGEVQFVSFGIKWIANCATQERYMPRNIKHADYPAIKIALSEVKWFAKKNGLSVAIPKIGAGLAGGDWNIIEGIIKEVFDDYEVTVYYL